jgi:flagellar biosynthesis protein FliR
MDLNGFNPNDPIWMSLLYQIMWTFFCVLSRVGTLLVVLPPLLGASVPMQVRALIAVMLTACMTPMVIDTAAPLPSSVLMMAIQLTKEILLGMLFGAALQVVMAGLQIGGQMMSSLASMDIAESADPMSQETTSVLNQMLSWIAMAIFLTVGGHRALLNCCLDSFEHYPAGAVAAETHWLMHVQDMLHHSISIGIRAAAPVAISLLVANLVTALIGRTMPQMNIMAIGFNINIMVLLGMLSLSVGSIGWVFQSELTVWIEQTSQALVRGKG